MAKPQSRPRVKTGMLKRANKRHPEGPRKPRRNDAKNRKDVLSDGFLQLLGRAEGNLLAGLDVDRFAGGGVAAHAGGALAHLEDAEADDADALALLEMLGDTGDQIVENGFCGFFRQFVLFRQGCCEMLERDGRRGRCFFRHIWPSSFVDGLETLSVSGLKRFGDRLTTLFCR